MFHIQTSERSVSAALIVFLRQELQGEDPRNLLEAGGEALLKTLKTMELKNPCDRSRGPATGDRSSDL